VAPHWCHSGAMELQPYLDDIHHQLTAAAAAGGEEARALAERLLAPLDAAIRLSLLDALSVAAQEISCELAPGSVEVRLRGRTPEFVVTTPPEPIRQDTSRDAWAPEGVATGPAGGPAGGSAGEEGGMARINLRLPEQLKTRIDQAAASGGFSVNSWLVRAATAALERTSRPQFETHGTPGPTGQQGPQRFTGWAGT
jgi:hypothetical protein